MTAHVAIIMGSDSDLPVMQEAAQVLDEFGIPHTTTIVSAHRTPDLMHTFAKEAAEKGLKVIIAGAGGAAHLPGMTAGLTKLPVIGVPIKTTNLKGLDSLLSIAQMPRGVPVATSSINGAYNAGLLAVKILALNDEVLSKKLDEYLRKQTEEVRGKAKDLERVGLETYLAKMEK